jgi:hypothetical protein
VDGNVDVAPDEKGLFVHDALVGSQVHALGELALGNEGTPRCFDAETEWIVSLLDSAGVTSPAHFQNSRSEEAVRNRRFSAEVALDYNAQAVLRGLRIEWPSVNSIRVFSLPLPSAVFLSCSRRLRLDK